MAQYTPKKMMLQSSASKGTASKKNIVQKGTAMPLALKPDKNDNVSVRPIMNGFIVSHSGSRGKGANQTYFNKEYHSPVNPIKFGGGKK